MLSFRKYLTRLKMSQYFTKAGQSLKIKIMGQALSDCSCLRLLKQFRSNYPLFHFAYWELHDD